MRIHFIWITLVSVVLLMSCGSNRVVTIDSQPQGADVIADGKVLGKTPLKIESDVAFPPRWIGGSYMVKGKLELKKSDCEPVVMKVNDSVLSNNINQKLTCSDKQVTQSNPPANSQNEKPLPTNKNITQRLEKLNQLHKKGLITDSEFKSQRLRILNEL